MQKISSIGTIIFKDMFHLNWIIFHSQWRAEYKEVTI